MEDRYLSKAKRISDGEWVVGYIIRYGHTGKEKYYIVPTYASDLYCFLIDKNTICRCTGLKDKNSTLIYENDIAKDEKVNLYKVFWQKNYYQYSWICIKSNYLPVGAQWNLWSIKSFETEVIGNIFDNPELLESEE